MQICQTHWNKLRHALEQRGLSEFGAKTGAQAIAAIVTELEGRAAENDFDPLMSCHWMIQSQAIKTLGLALLAPHPDGREHRCPICEIVVDVERYWIDGPADAMLKEAREKGLVPDVDSPAGPGETGADPREAGA